MSTGLEYEPMSDKAYEYMENAMEQYAELRLGDVVGRGEQLPCEMCGGNIDKEDKFTDEKHCENCGWF